MQAYITRFTVPADIGALRRQFETEGMLDIEMAASFVPMGPLMWNVPRHAMVGDVVFFQVTMKSLTNARLLKKELASSSGDFHDALDLGIRLAEEYAGSIIGVGRVIEDAERIRQAPDGRVRSTFFAWIDDVTALIGPLRLTGRDPWRSWPEFTGPGPVTCRQFTSDARFRELVDALHRVDPELPDWLLAAHIDPIPDGTRLTKDNWMHYATTEGAVFTSEAHLQGLYGDWLLRDLSDRRTLYTEVGVTKTGRRTGQVDYVIIVNGVPVPVEAKLDADHEFDLDAQLDKYRQPDQLKAGSRSLATVIHDVVGVVDRHGFTITQAGDRPTEPTLARESTTSKTIHTLRRKLEAAIR